MKSFFSICLIMASVATQAQVIRPQTDLGAQGNQYAAKRFAQYRSEASVCGAPNPNKRRVLLSGFGPFDGGTQNASGEIVAAFGGFAAPKGNDVDVYGATRDVTIKGVDYQICFLVTSVVWDIAAAILISEMERFQSHFALVTGIGDVSVEFETGNSNRATFIGGFDMEGNPVMNNLPQENYVLPPSDPSVPFIAPLTWNAQAARDAVEADVRAMGIQTMIPEAGRPENDYICNNIAFVASHAIQNLRTELAGGMITLNPHFAVAPKLGFMHYPQTPPTDPASMGKWMKILSKIISVE